MVSKVLLYSGLNGSMRAWAGQRFYSEAPPLKTSGILNPRNLSHCKGKTSLPRGEGDTTNLPPVPAMDLLPRWSQGRLSILSRLGNLPDSILTVRSSSRHLKWGIFKCSIHNSWHVMINRIITPSIECLVRSQFTFHHMLSNTENKPGGQGFLVLFFPNKEIYWEGFRGKLPKLTDLLRHWPEIPLGSSNRY